MTTAASSCREHLPIRSVDRRRKRKLRRRGDGTDDVAFIAYTSGHHGRPQGRCPPSALPGSATKSLVRFWHDYRPGRRRRMPLRAGMAVADRVHVSLCNGQGSDGGLLRSTGRAFRSGSVVSAVCAIPHHEFHRPAHDLSDDARGREAARRATIFPVGGMESAPASRSRKTRSTAIERSFGVRRSRRHRHDRVHGLLPQSRSACPSGQGSCGQPGPGTVIELLDDDLNPVPTGDRGRSLRPPRQPPGDDEGILAETRSNGRSLPRPLVRHRRRAHAR